MSVIGGFLGAGKTTLLNTLLEDAGGVRYAVLVNDFGDLAIDGELIAKHGGETVTLANGCICCTIGDDLLVTLMRLLEAEVWPEHVLVEASGIADPRPIADIAVLHPGLARDAVVVLVDASNVRAKADDARLTDTVERQLAAADIVVLNKCDLIDAAERARLRAWLGERASAAAILDAEHARVPAALLLGGPLEMPAPAPPHRNDAAHAGTFDAVSLTIGAPLDEARFRRTVEALPETVLRAKGIVRFAAEPDQRRAFQMVGRRYQITDAPGADAGAGSRLVFLGIPPMPDAADLERRLRRRRRTAPTSWGGHDAGADGRR
jgi:G3E family GTPase